MRFRLFYARLIAIRMPAMFPVVDDCFQRLFDRRNACFLLEKTLHRQLGICFVDVFPAHRGRIEDEWNALFAQFGIVVDVALELDTALPGHVDVAEDQERLLLRCFQMGEGISRIREPNELVLNAEIPQYKFQDFLIIPVVVHNNYWSCFCHNFLIYLPFKRMSKVMLF